MSIPDRDEVAHDIQSSRSANGAALGPAQRGRLWQSLVAGVIAAAIGCLIYSSVAGTLFAGLVAIGVAWLTAKSMMTASQGVGGLRHQVSASLLTYLAISCGGVLFVLRGAHHIGVPVAEMFTLEVLEHALFGPWMQLSEGRSGIVSAVILAICMRAAWQWAGGTPGFRWPGRVTADSPGGA